MSQDLFPGEGRSGLAMVTLRAAVDREFRRRLLRDPRRAIRETFGVEVSPGLRLKFIEKGRHLDLLVVLPDLVRDAERR